MATNTMVPPVRAATNGSTVNGNYTNGSNGNYTNGNYTNGNATYSNSNQLQPSDTISSVNFPRDLFEQLYLSPENRVKGDLRKTFGNPTPLALIGFVVAAFPLGCDLMGWRGAGGYGAANIGAYLFMGGLLQIIGAVLEFFLGNTFPFVVFGTIGGFWLSFGATIQPFYNAEAAYANGATTLTPQFAASYAFFLVIMAVISFMFLVCSLRTNVLLVLIFICLTMSFGFLAGAYWHLSGGNFSLALKLQTGGGALIFALSIFGLLLLFIQLLASVDFPMPAWAGLGDLSTRFKSGSEIRKAKKEISHKD